MDGKWYLSVMRRLAAALLLGLALASAARAAEPRPQPDLLTPDPGAEWRSTAKLRTDVALSLHLAEQVATGLFLAWLAFSGRAARLRDRLPAWLRWRTARNAAYIALLSLFLFLVGLPFAATRY